MYNCCNITHNNCIAQHKFNGICGKLKRRKIKLVCYMKFNARASLLRYFSSFVCRLHEDSFTMNEMTESNTEAEETN